MEGCGSESYQTAGWKVVSLNPIKLQAGRLWVWILSNCRLEGHGSESYQTACWKVMGLNPIKLQLWIWIIKVQVGRSWVWILSKCRMEGYGSESYQTAGWTAVGLNPISHLRVFNPDWLLVGTATTEKVMWILKEQWWSHKNKQGLVGHILFPSHLLFIFQTQNGPRPTIWWENTQLYIIKCTSTFTCTLFSSATIT